MNHLRRCGRWRGDDRLLRRLRRSRQRRANTKLPIGGEDAQVADVGEVVVVEVAAFPVLARLPACSEPAKVRDVDLSVEACVAGVGELAEDGRGVDALP